MCSGLCEDLRVAQSQLHRGPAPMDEELFAGVAIGGGRPLLAAGPWLCFEFVH